MSSFFFFLIIIALHFISILIGSDGRLLSCGSSKLFQSGHFEQEFTFTPIESFKGKATRVAAGKAHTIVSGRLDFRLQEGIIRSCKRKCSACIMNSSGNLSFIISLTLTLKMRMVAFTRLEMAAKVSWVILPRQTN
jgi:hypothetical protein